MGWALIQPDSHLRTLSPRMSERSLLKSLEPRPFVDGDPVSNIKWDETWEEQPNLERSRNCSLGLCESCSV